MNYAFSFTHSVYVSGNDALSTLLMRTFQPFFRKKARYSSVDHSLCTGSPTSFIKNALTLPCGELRL